MLNIENLKVDYNHVSALKGISLRVEKNEIVTLLGGNGAGKTTTLIAVSNLTKKTGGKIVFEGKDITNLEPSKIVEMGISHVPEGRHIFKKLTVEENIRIGALSIRKVTKDEIKSRCGEMFDLFPRLKERRKKYGGSLSGGEQQMLAIARGLMMKPKLLMLDEPSLGLAPILVEEIFVLLEKLKSQGITTLLIEQNAVMALNAADRGYVLQNGEIVINGKGQELLNNPNIQKAYLGI